VALGSRGFARRLDPGRGLVRRCFLPDLLAQRDDLSSQFGDELGERGRTVASCSRLRDHVGKPAVALLALPADLRARFEKLRLEIGDALAVLGRLLPRSGEEPDIRARSASAEAARDPAMRARCSATERSSAALSAARVAAVVRSWAWTSWAESSATRHSKKTTFSNAARRRSAACARPGESAGLPR
jgi:hypothetical protein